MMNPLLAKTIRRHFIEAAGPVDVRLERIDHQIAVGMADRALMARSAD